MTADRARQLLESHVVPDDVIDHASAPARGAHSLAVAALKLFAEPAPSIDAVSGLVEPERIRVAQDAEGFWTCREAISGSQEYVRADLYEAQARELAAKEEARVALCRDLNHASKRQVELEDRIAALEDAVRVKDEALADPVAVHRNMLAGTIAKPSTMNIAHLYPEVQEMRQALIATLKHFRHPTSAEHETRDKVMAALSHFDDPPLTPYFARTTLSNGEPHDR